MFSYASQNADHFSFLVERIQISYYFRKWISNVDLQQKQRDIDAIRLQNNEQDAGMDAGEQITESNYKKFYEEKKKKQEQKEKQAEEEKLRAEQNNGNELIQEKPITLKIGDIIYLKYYVDKRKNGIISGDGIASNQLECIPQSYEQIRSSSGGSNVKDIDSDQGDINGGKQRNIIEKNAQLMFRQCLFKVLSVQKYYYTEMLKEYKQQNTKKDDTELKDQIRKADEEQRDNENNFRRLLGMNVVYGQQIQLQHLYSETYLTLNKSILAQQSCCREMSLEQNSSKWSNFIILSNGNAKQIGQSVLYSDQIILTNSLKRLYSINVDITEHSGTVKNGLLDQFQEGLQVNASQTAASLQLCSYKDSVISMRREENEEKRNCFETGQVIMLENRYKQSKLAVRPRSGDHNPVTSNYGERKILFEVDNSPPIEMIQNYYDSHRAIKQINQQFQLVMISNDDINDNQTIEVLWEIQAENAFSGNLLSYDRLFRLKNVATNLYLCVYTDSRQSKQKEEEDSEIPQPSYCLSLTYQGHQQDCLFSLSTKQAVKAQNSNISFDSFVKILFTKDGCPVQQLFIEDEKTIKIVAQTQIEKKRRQQSLLELKKVDVDLRNSADRVSSLYPYLLRFHIFLQNWGIQVTPPKYNYSHAFLHQKDLYNHILELNQSLDNLEEFLKEDEKTDNRQTVLMNSGITIILVQILRLIHFMIYGSKISGKQTAFHNNIIQSQVPQRSAQKIAQMQLSKTVIDIYQLLTKCIVGNGITATNLLSKKFGFVEFFLDQIKYYGSDVKSVLRESVRYNQTVDEDQDEILDKWLKRVNIVTEENIDDVSFIIQVLGHQLNDPIEQPIPHYQNQLQQRLLQTSTGAVSEMRKIMLHFQIVTVEIQEEKEKGVFQTQERIFVKFGSYQMDQFLANNKKFQDIYSKSYKNETIRRKLQLHKGFAKSEEKRGDDQEDQKGIDLIFIDRKHEKEVEKETKAQQVPILDKYEDYIINSLNFYSHLCKGRNKKIMRLLQTEINLTQELIFLGLQLFKERQINFFNSFLNLYMNMILDREPLTRISCFKNETFILDDLKSQNFSIENQSYQIFKDVTMQKLNLKNENPLDNGPRDDTMSTHQQIQKRAETIVQKNYPINQELVEDRFLIDGEEGRQMPKSFQIETNKQTRSYSGVSEKQMSQEKESSLKIQINSKMKTFFTMLRCMNYLIDLGYNNLEINGSILRLISNIILGIIESQNPRQQNKKNRTDSPSQSQKTPHTSSLGKMFTFSQQQLDEPQNASPLDSRIKNFLENCKNWTYEFVRDSFTRSEDDLLKTQICVETLRILDTLYTLKVNLQVILAISLTTNPNKYATPENEDIDQNDYNKISLYRNLSFQNLDIFDQTFEDPNFIPPSYLLFQLLCHFDDNFRIQKEVMFLQNKLFLQHQELLGQMRNVQVIQDQYLISLFHRINGNSESTQKSPQDYQYFLKKFLVYMSLRFQLEEIKIQKEKLNQQKDQEERRRTYRDSKREPKNIRENAPNMREDEKNSQDSDEKSREQYLQFAQEQLNMRENDFNQAKFSKISLFLQDYNLDELIDLFQLPDYEKYDSANKSSEAVYKRDLQNIIRNTGLLDTILQLLKPVPEIFSRNLQNQLVDLSDFYKKVIIFLQLMCDKNDLIQQQILPYLDHILLLCLLPPDPEENSDLNELKKRKESVKTKPGQIKVHKLVIPLLFLEQKNESIAAKYIDKLVDMIELYKPFQTVKVNEGRPKELTQLNLDKPNTHAVIQYLKILQMMNKAERQQYLRPNQELVLKKIMQSDLLSSIVSPISILEIELHYGLLPDKQPKKISENSECMLKLHVAGIEVLTDAAQNYLLGINQVQRLILYDTLQNTIVSKSSPYILQKAYLRCLFECYINQVFDLQSNDTNYVISTSEVSEILSRDIIPQLDTKNIYVYLEGLVRISKNQQSQVPWDLRKQIIKEKLIYFQKNREFSSLVLADQNSFKPSEIKHRQYPGIVKDVKQFWKYIMKYGVLHFLIDVFDEYTNEILKQDSSSTLGDEYMIIKNNLIQLRQLFDVLEKDFRIRKEDVELDRHRRMLSRLEQIIPNRKIIQFGQNFRIGMDMNSKVNVETYTSLTEDKNGAGGHQIGVFSDSAGGNDSVLQQDTQFQRSLRMFCLRNRQSVQDFLNSVRKRLEIQKKLNFAIFDILNRSQFYLSYSDIEKYLEIYCKCEAHVGRDQKQYFYQEGNFQRFLIQTKYVLDQKNREEGENQLDLDDSAVVQQLLRNSEGSQSENSVLAANRKGQTLDIDKFKQEFPEQRIEFLLQRYYDLKDLLKNSQKENEVQSIEQGGGGNDEDILQDLDQDTKIEIACQQLPILQLIYSIRCEQKSLFKEQDKKVQNQNQFLEFVKTAIRVFESEEEITLLQIFRIILEVYEISEDDIENLNNDDLSIKSVAQMKIRNFKKLQNQLIQSLIYQLAFRLIKSGTPANIIKECFVFLNQLLLTGTLESQHAILDFLQSNREVEISFLNFIRSFFQQNITEKMKEIQEINNANQDTSLEVHTEFEILCKHILKFLELSCQNVNEKFQDYLREQNPSKLLATNINIVFQVSNLLSSFLEDSHLQIQEKDHLISQCIDTLIELCTGNQSNQNILYQNQRFFKFIDSKILKRQDGSFRRNFEPPPINYQDQQDFDQNQGNRKKEYDIQQQRYQNEEQDIQMLKSTSELLLILVVGNSDEEVLIQILDCIDFNHLSLLLVRIYEERLKKQKQQIILQMECDHKSDDSSNTQRKCTDRMCELKKVTDEDRDIIETGFNIFIFMYYLRDVFQHNETLKKKLQLVEFVDYNDVPKTDLGYDSQDEENELGKNNQETHQLIDEASSQKYQISNQEKPSRHQTAPMPGSSINLNQTDQKHPLLNQISQSKEVEMQAINKDNQNNVNQNMDLNIVDIIQQETAKFQKENEANEDQYIFNQNDQLKLDRYREKLKLGQKAQFYKFFSKFVGSTQIVFKNQVVKIYFQKPFTTEFITPFIQQHLIFSSNRGSDTQRIQFLIDNYEFYFDLMNHKQNISKHWILEQLVDNWRNIKDISFYMVLAMAIINLLTYDDLQDGDGQTDFTWFVKLNQIITYIQLSLSILIFIFCAIERYPISMNSGLVDTNSLQILVFQFQAGFKQNYFEEIYHRQKDKFFKYFDPKVVKQSLGKRILLMIIDFENIYNLGYLALTALAFDEPFFYAVLLLDVVQKSEDLQNIIRSITLNVVNLLQFTFLGLIILYLFGVYGFLQLRGLYDAESGGHSDTFVNTVTSTIYAALIGESVSANMSGVERDGETFWKRYTFDFLGYILINTLFLQILFGIILDTFGELREQRTELLEEVTGQCYICGIEKSVIDSKSQRGWIYHIYQEHNVYHALFYLIYISRLYQNQCDAMEKQVKFQLRNKQIDFMPILRASSVDDGTVQESEE